jgi:hypothetical protein
MATANKHGKVLTSSLIKSKRQDPGIDKNHSIDKNQTKIIREIQLALCAFGPTHILNKPNRGSTFFRFIKSVN